ncbi:DOMON domain-containing protein frrs1L [Mactra antiquata]
MKILLLFVTLIVVVSGYQTGPPSTQCGNMKPEHGVGATSNGNTRFEIICSKYTYSPNEVINVTLRGKSSDDTFRGFLIQPRKAADVSGTVYKTVGSITSNPSNTRDPCVDSTKTALCHKDNNDKTSVTFSWTAPSDDQGNIQFVATVVHIRRTFYMGLTSTTLTFESPTNPSTSKPITNQPTNEPTNQPTNEPTNQPTNQVTDAPTNPPPSGQITRDSACEATKNCYPGQSECSANCTYLVSWSAVGDDDVEFSLAVKTDGSLNYWVAIGFSDDRQMNNDSVVACIANNGEVAVKNTYNAPEYKYNAPVQEITETFGLSQTTQSLVDGILRCSFRRKKNAALADAALGRRRRAVDGEAEFFDLSSSWYLIVAHGPASQGNVMKHVEYPDRSLEKIDFFGTFSVAPTRAPVELSGVIKKDKECGKTKGCYHDCSGDDNCGFELTWVPDGDDGEDVLLSLSCMSGNNAFCAIGLSSDDKMGDDSVFECVEYNGKVTVYVSYNPGKFNTRLNNDQFGITVTDTSHVDGVLTCVFKRKKTFALQEAATSGRKKRSVDPSASNFFDMTKDWTLLYAYGPAGPGNVDKHSMSPIISSEKADFQSFMDIGGEAKSRILVQVHGILMIVAWMVCASVGIVVAKFYKPVWPEDQDWFGKRRWFVIHRGLMVLTVLCTATAFVLIFIHVGNFSEIVGSNFQKAHPIIGIVVMALALINPTVAICRPHPGTPKRVYFNVFHGFVGGAAHTCSIVNIFAGTMLTSANVPDVAVYILYAFVGWFGLAYLVLVFYDCCEKKDSREEAYEMKSDGSNSAPIQKKKTYVLKKLLLTCHVLIVVGLTIGLCVMVAVPHIMHDHE